MTPDQRRRALEIARELTSLKAELGQIGLFKTMHEMEKPVTAIGYEIAEKAPR